MFKSKRVVGSFIIFLVVIVFSILPAFAQDLTPAKKTAITWVDGTKGEVYWRFVSRLPLRHFHIDLEWLPQTYIAS